MNEPLIRIVLADDHQMIRESWKMLLDNKPGFRVVADCRNGKDAIACTREHLPDILLVDINIYPVIGFEVTRRIHDEFPGVRIIGISANNQPNYAMKMLELGARGYLTKTSPLEEIHHGIQLVYQGSPYVCEEIKKFIPPSG